MAKCVFKETAEGLVAHTAISKLLATVPVLNEYVGFVCDELWPSAARVGFLS